MPQNSCSILSYVGQHNYELGGGCMFEVRRAGTGDERLWLSAVASIFSEEDRDERIATDVELASALEDSRCLLFLALSEETPVGLLSAYIFPDVSAGGSLAYLYDIEVRESHRRAGVGTALIEALVAGCRAAGVTTIWAGTDVSNQAARRTFERTGADLEGESYAEYEWDLASW